MMKDTKQLQLNFDGHLVRDPRCLRQVVQRLTLSSYLTPASTVLEPLYRACMTLAVIR